MAIKLILKKEKHHSTGSCLYTALTPACLSYTPLVLLSGDIGRLDVGLIGIAWRHVQKMQRPDALLSLILAAGPYQDSLALLYTIAAHALQSYGFNQDFTSMAVTTLSPAVLYVYNKA